MGKFIFVRNTISDLELDPRKINSLETLPGPVSKLRGASKNRGWSISGDRFTNRSVLKAPSGEVEL